MGPLQSPTAATCCLGKPWTWSLFAEHAVCLAAFLPAESSCIGMRMPLCCHQSSLYLDSLSDMQSDSTVGGGLMAHKRHRQQCFRFLPSSAPLLAGPSAGLVGRGGIGLCIGGSAGLPALLADLGPPLVLGLHICSSEASRFQGVTARWPGPHRELSLFWHHLAQPLLGSLPGHVQEKPRKTSSCFLPEALSETEMGDS